jgi:hypothetical protein
MSGNGYPAISPGKQILVGDAARKADYYTRQCLWGIYKEPRGFLINYVTYDVYNSGKQIVDDLNPA